MVLTCWVKKKKKIRDKLAKVCNSGTKLWKYPIKNLINTFEKLLFKISKRSWSILKKNVFFFSFSHKQTKIKCCPDSSLVFSKLK